MKARFRICRTASGRVVREGDPAAAYLVCGIGSDVPAEYEAGYKALLEPEPPEQKEVKPVADKAIKAAPVNKSTKAPTKKRK